jgi:hypothetical protein
MTPLERAIRKAKMAMAVYTWLSRSGWLAFTILSVAVPALVLKQITDRPKPQVLVVAADRLAPYQQIGAADIAVAGAFSRPGALERPEQAVGRFAVRAMKKGDVIDSASVSPPSGGLVWSRSRVLAIPIKPIPKGISGGLPKMITLAGAPKSGQTARFKAPAILLAVDDSKDVTATVALSDADLESLLKVLASCDFYVVFAGS